MNTELNYSVGEEKGNQKGSEQGKTNSQEDVEISQPKTERPDGPFEHSGETAGWTKEEKEENDDKEEEDKQEQTK